MSSRPRVFHVTTIAESLKVLLGNQLCAIGAAGFEVCGVSAPGEGAFAIEERGVRHLPVGFVRQSGLTPRADARAFADLVALFRRERPTIVHTHTAKADLYAALAARAAGVPIVVSTLHGFYFDDRMAWKRRAFYAGLASLGMLACDAVLSQNPEDVATAVQGRMCPREKISVLGNGIDVERFDPARVGRSDVARLRRELGIADDAPVIGFVGRLVAEKGVRELFAACRLVREKFPGAVLLLVGMVDAAKADAISAATAEAYGVGGMCRFAGRRDDMPELYALMDVCALPSHREGFPRTPMEAAAMGVPVVASNIRGCRSAVRDGDSGILVPLGEVASLAGAIEALLGDPARRKQMGLAGRKLARTSFDERQVFDRVLATYHRLLERRGLRKPAVYVREPSSMLRRHGR